MNLKHLTDKALLLDVKHIVQQERKLTTELLHYLKEIDRRKLFSDLKYSSLFEFCVKELKYSEASAYRRIQAARLLKDLPEIEQKIESGLLTLANIAQANQFFKENNVEEIKDKRQVLNQLENLSRSDGEKKLIELSGKERPDNTKITFILSQETLKLIDRANGLLHRPHNSNELIQLMAKSLIKELESKKFKLTNRPAALSPVKVTRTPQNHIKREIYLKDRKCSECGSDKYLNYDHIIPWSMGGQTSLDNLRLLCSNCNQRARIRAGLVKQT